MNQDGKVDGFQFELKNPIYRSFPFSSLTFDVTIDGRKVPLKDVSFFVRKQRVEALNATTISEIWWHFGQVMSVYVRKVGGLSAGEHEIGLELEIAFPSQVTWKSTTTSHKAKMLVE